MFSSPLPAEGFAFATSGDRQSASAIEIFANITNDSKNECEVDSTG